MYIIWASIENFFSVVMLLLVLGFLFDQSMKVLFQTC